MPRRHRNTKSYIVQVPVDAEFLKRIDWGAGMVRESRAAFVRKACGERLKLLRDEENDRRYESAYRKAPESTAWANMSAKMLASFLAEEK